jgi:hypothetical protein
MKSPAILNLTPLLTALAHQAGALHDAALVALRHADGSDAKLALLVVAALGAVVVACALFSLVRQHLAKGCFLYPLRENSLTRNLAASPVKPPARR